LDWAAGLLKKPTVGIFARGRKTYGRNLTPEFYVKLIQNLESMGYQVIWLGEKQSTQPCPVPHVLDFSRMPESRDLERTLAIICNLEFTIQFWTASTRLAGIMGVPFLLFESPEQVYVSYAGIMGAQEGKRLELTSFGPKKVVLAHYMSVMDKPDEALELANRAIREMREGNYEEILGMVEDMQFSTQLQEEHREMLK
jgi:ADP-heptose:LPS heptosyltransferase